MTSGVTWGAGFRREQLARQRDSGLSISEFGRRSELSIHPFRRRQRRFDEAPPLFREVIVNATSVVGDQSGAAPRRGTVTGDLTPVYPVAAPAGRFSLTSRPVDHGKSDVTRSVVAIGRGLTNASPAPTPAAVPVRIAAARTRSRT